MNEKTKNALLSIVASLVCIVIGLLVGFIILYCINAENAVDGFTRIIKGGFYLKPKGIGSEIAQSAPLIMTGLSVAFAFKTGLFNIGAAGQYTVGVFGALYFAIILHMPWYVCLLAAMVCGAIWGAVPGIFKAYFNVNEVITSIMFNWIGLYLVNELMYNTIPGMYDQKTTRTYKLSSASPKSLIPDCGMNSIFRTSSTTIAIFIAIAIAVIIYIVLNKTTFGYELKACGFNKDAAKYAGINEKRNVVLSMTIAGALAGIGAGLYFGVIFAALFVANISVGGAYLPTKYYQPEIADLIVAVIIYLCAFVTLFKGIVANLFKSKKEQKANANADNGKEEKK